MKHQYIWVLITRIKSTIRGVDSHCSYCEMYKFSTRRQHSKFWMLVNYCNRRDLNKKYTWRNASIDPRKLDIQVEIQNLLDKSPRDLWVAVSPCWTSTTDCWHPCGLHRRIEHPWNRVDPIQVDPQRMAPQDPSLQDVTLYFWALCGSRSKIIWVNSWYI